MEIMIYVKKLFDFHIFSFFWFSIVILSYTLFYPCRSSKHSNCWRHKLGHTYCMTYCIL